MLLGRFFQVVCASALVGALALANHVRPRPLNACLRYRSFANISKTHTLATKKTNCNVSPSSSEYRLRLILLDLSWPTMGFVSI